MIDEALGVSAAANDLNGDGVVNVVDVQIVMNASPNLDCSASGATPASVRVSERPAVRTIAIAAQRLAIAAPRLAITEVMNAASFRSGPISPGERRHSNGHGSRTWSPGVVRWNAGASDVRVRHSDQLRGAVRDFWQGELRYSGSLPRPHVQSVSSRLRRCQSGTLHGQRFRHRSSRGFEPGPQLQLTHESAAKGSTVVLFLTGEGQTSPPGVTGKVTTQSAVPPLTPQPILPVRVLIGGQTASIAFYGRAPGWFPRGDAARCADSIECSAGRSSDIGFRRRETQSERRDDIGAMTPVGNARPVHFP